MKIDELMMMIDDRNVLVRGERCFRFFILKRFGARRRRSVVVVVCVLS